MSTFERQVNFFLKKYFFNSNFHKKGVKINKNIFNNHDLNFFMKEVVKSNDKIIKKEFGKVLKEWECKDTIPFIGMKTIEIRLNYKQYVKLDIENYISIKDFMYIKGIMMKICKFDTFGCTCKYSFNENEIKFDIIDLISLLFTSSYQGKKEYDTSETTLTEI